MTMSWSIHRIIMFLECPKKEYLSLKPLFENYQTARSIVLPALEQKRGTLWVDDLDNPSVARFLVGVINFFGGDSSNPIARELIAEVKPIEVMMAPSDDWNELIREIWADRLGTQVRTRMSADSLDINHLRELRDTLSDEFKLERVDLATIKRLDKRQNMHIPIFFGSSQEFIENGIGFCIKHEGKVISMASTFAPFIDEFEIEVRTNDDSRYRHRGFATVVSAALILYALEHGLVPHWDAANDASVGLALKLGYTNPVRWNAFYVTPISDTTSG